MDVILTQLIEFAATIDTMPSMQDTLSAIQEHGFRKLQITEELKLHTMIVSLENLYSLLLEEDLLIISLERAKYMDGLLSEMRKLSGKM